MDINAKREHAKKLQRAANQKISRNRAKGVELGGTEYDKRRDIGKIKRYNGKQLDNYISELSGFVSRKQQFVKDTFNRPMPKGEWRVYESLQTQNTQNVNSAFDKVSHLFNPLSGMTLKQRMELMTADRINAGNRRVNAAYSPIQRNPENIASLASLKKLTEQMKKQVTPGKHEKDMKLARRSFMKMLDQMNDQSIRGNKKLGIDPVRSLKSLAKDLTQEQFNVLWQYTTLPDMADYNYQSAQDTFAANENESYRRKDLLNIEDVMSGNRQEMRSLLEWGKTINLRG